MDFLETTDRQLNMLMDHLFGERDPRVRGWLLLDSYTPTLVLSLLYLLVVLIGPRVMSSRPAFSVRRLLIGYNLCVTMLSLYMLIELLRSSWAGGYKLLCQGLHDAGEADMRVARVLWWYYFSKLVEFLDTVFFILRKKDNQITFLHVYHHVSMFNIWWCCLNWIPCGQSFFGPTLNSFIHVWMYSYYGLSALPAMQPYLWWKRHLTQAQLIQFVLTILHTVSGLVFPCGFPEGCLQFQTCYMFSLVLLFLNFYRKTYKKQHTRDDNLPATPNDIKLHHNKKLFLSTNGSNQKNKKQ